jgi:hypothetical protein
LTDPAERVEGTVEGGLSRPLAPTKLLPPGFEDQFECAAVFREEFEEFRESDRTGKLSLDPCSMLEGPLVIVEKVLCVVLSGWDAQVSEYQPSLTYVIRLSFNLLATSLTQQSCNQIILN